MQTILLDTSFLIACADFKLDYFSELERVCTFPYKIATIDTVIDELNVLETKGTLKQRSAAKLARTIVEQKKIEVLPTTGKGSTDDRLVAAATKDTLIATIDGELKQRLKKKGVSVIVVRQKRYLQMLQN